MLIRTAILLGMLEICGALIAYRIVAPIISDNAKALSQIVEAFNNVN